MLKRIGIFLAGLVFVTVIAIVIGRSLFPLPDISGRTAELSLPRDPDTRLAQRIRPAMVGQ